MAEVLYSISKYLNGTVENELLEVKDPILSSDNITVDISAFGLVNDITVIKLNFYDYNNGQAIPFELDNNTIEFNPIESGLFKISSETAGKELYCSVIVSDNYPKIKQIGPYTNLEFQSAKNPTESCILWDDNSTSVKYKAIWDLPEIRGSGDPLSVNDKIEIDLFESFCKSVNNTIVTNAKINIGYNFVPEGISNYNNINTELVIDGYNFKNCDFNFFFSKANFRNCTFTNCKFHFKTASVIFGLDCQFYKGTGSTVFEDNSIIYLADPLKTVIFSEASIIEGYEISKLAGSPDFITILSLTVNKLLYNGLRYNDFAWYSYNRTDLIDYSKPLSNDIEILLTYNENKIDSTYTLRYANKIERDIYTNVSTKFYYYNSSNFPYVLEGPTYYVKHIGDSITIEPNKIDDENKPYKVIYYWNSTADIKNPLPSSNILTSESLEKNNSGKYYLQLSICDRNNTDNIFRLPEEPFIYLCVEEPLKILKVNNIEEPTDKIIEQTDILYVNSEFIASIDSVETTTYNLLLNGVSFNAPQINWYYTNINPIITDETNNSYINNNVVWKKLDTTSNFKFQLTTNYYFRVEASSSYTIDGITYPWDTYTSNIIFKYKIIKSDEAYENDMSSNIVLCKVSFKELETSDISVGNNYMVFSSSKDKGLVETYHNVPSIFVRNPETVLNSLSTKEREKIQNEKKYQFPLYSFPTDIAYDKLSGNWVVTADKTSRTIYVFNARYKESDSRLNYEIIKINVPTLVGIKDKVKFISLGFKVFMYGEYIAISDPYSYEDTNGIIYSGRVLLFKFDAGNKTVKLFKLIKSPVEQFDGSFGDNIEFDDFGNIIISASEEINSYKYGYDISNTGTIIPNKNMDQKIDIQSTGAVYIYSLASLESETSIFSEVVPAAKLTPQVIIRSINEAENSWGKLTGKINVLNDYWIQMPTYKNNKYELSKINYTTYNIYEQVYNFYRTYNIFYAKLFPTKLTEEQFAAGIFPPLNYYNDLPQGASQISIGKSYKAYAPINKMEYGLSFSISDKMLIIGAPAYNNDTGMVELWQYDKPSKSYKYISTVINEDNQKIRFGRNIKIYYNNKSSNGYTVISSASVSKNGVLQLIPVDGSTINTKNIKLVAPTINTESFGESIAIYGDTFIVGSPKESKVYRYKYYRNSANIDKVESVQIIDLDKLDTNTACEKIAITKNRMIVSYPVFSLNSNGINYNNIGAVIQYTLIGNEFRIF